MNEELLTRHEKAAHEVEARAGDVGRCTIQAHTGGVRKDKAQMKWNMAGRYKAMEKKILQRDHQQQEN